MQNEKTIFVTGATGNQGGAAARFLLASGFRVRALTRDMTSTQAQSLKKTNAELVLGNLEEPASFRDALRGVDGVFGVMAQNKNVEKEKQQGINLVNIAGEAGISNFIYSSVIGADANTGIPHWESKNEIENHLRRSGLSFTILRPASLFENFLIPEVRSRVKKGKLVTPTRKETIQQFVSAIDVGRIATTIFLNPSKYAGQTIHLASEQFDMQEVTDIFSKVLDKKMIYQKLPGLITRLAMGRDLHTMFKWVNKHNAVFVEDLPALKAEFPGMLGLEEWVRRAFKK